LKLSIRYILKGLLLVIILFVLTWIVVWSYVMLNKASIISKVTLQINEKIKGDIHIGDIDPSLFSTFPYVSLRLSGVMIRDSLWKNHHHNFLQAGNIFIRPEILSIFSAKPKINKVIIEEAGIYFFTDSTGYTNEYILHPHSTAQKEDTSTVNAKPAIPDIVLKNVHFVMDNQVRKKLYDFDIQKLSLNVTTSKNLLDLDVKTNILVHSLTFNSSNGSFMQEKPLEGKFKLNFNFISKKLEFNKITLTLDNHPFLFTGSFDLSSAPPLYKLLIETENASYKKIAFLLSPNISKKLNNYNIEKPVSVNALLDGSRLPNNIPLVQIQLITHNNNISTPIGIFTNASFTGVFLNHLFPDQPPVDKNSALIFKSLRAKWEGIPFNSRSISITNLEFPFLNCDVTSKFDLSSFNDLAGSNTIRFTNGNGKMNVTFKGPLMDNDTAASHMYGDMVMEEANIDYLPRNFSFNGCSGKLQFSDKDVYIEQLKAKTGSTSLTLNGNVKNFLALLNKNPEKLVLNWKIYSPKLILSDFISYLGKPKSNTSKQPAKKAILKVTSQIDRMLKDCNVEIEVKADKLNYKRFAASDLSASLSLSDNLLALKNVLLTHAGGTLALSGSLMDDGSNNFLKLNTKIKNVNIPEMFTAFNNFKQDAILDRNLEGRLSAALSISAYLTNKAELAPGSLKGILDISLKDGQLIDFEPVKKISEKVFKKRDFANISFAELKDRLVVDGNEIKINRMEMQSSVLSMFVEGVYDLKKGVDLSIQVPMSNLKKKDETIELKNKGVNGKTGISLRLRAKTGEDGKAKITWDPFNKALKNKDKNNSDSTQRISMQPVVH
jgi:AsmA-like C-terminal region